MLVSGRLCRPRHCRPRLCCCSHAETPIKGGLDSGATEDQAELGKPIQLNQPKQTESSKIERMSAEQSRNDAS